MPYEIKQSGDQFCVVKKDGGKQVGCHPTREAAEKQMAALYANVPDAKPKESARTGYFAVLADLRESQLDAEQFIARGVTLIRPGFSTNTDRAGRPRYYSRATLEAAAAKYDGTRAYYNHPTQTQAKELPERDVRDIAGYFKNVRPAPDGALVGDLHILGAARNVAWPLIAEAATNKPDLIQLSSNALGQTVIGEAEGKAAVIVESIIGVNSVDLVTTGAAGGTFAGALLQSDADGWTRDLLGAMGYGEWREARPEFVERLKGEWKTIRETEALKEAHSALEQARGEVAALREQYRAELTELADYRRGALADRLLAQSNLPLTLRAAIRAELIAEADAEKMQARLEREQAKWRAAPRAPVAVTGAGPAPAGGGAGEPAGGSVRQAAAAVFGLSESRTARPDETAEEYKARMARITN